MKTVQFLKDDVTPHKGGITGKLYAINPSTLQADMVDEDADDAVRKGSTLVAPAVVLSEDLAAAASAEAAGNETEDEKTALAQKLLDDAAAAEKD